MANRHEIVNLAVDICLDKIKSEYTTADKEKDMQVLYDALVEANGGKKELTYKTLRGNLELFEIIEEILVLTDVQGFEGNPFFEQFVEYRNLALGDKNSFYIPDESLFLVNETAEGILSVNRQKINVGKTEVVSTKLWTIKAYEDLNMLLAGRINIVEFVARIQKSFMHQKLEKIYTVFYEGITGLPSAFTESGSFDEGNLDNIIDHVEASTGQTAIIVGTRQALGNIVGAVVSDQAKERYNQMGYYGVYKGTAMMMIPQSHKVGTHDFAISNKDLWIITSDTKPIKFVTEGDAIFETAPATNNEDLTVDLFAGERYGVGVLLNSYYGQYRLP